jgi:hypothetical protein
MLLEGSVGPSNRNSKSATKTRFPGFGGQRGFRVDCTAGRPNGTVDNELEDHLWRIDDG